MIKKLPNILKLEIKKSFETRYGENPHQRGAFYINLKEKDSLSIQNFIKLQGKEISFNNLLDASSVINALAEIEEKRPACVIIKHGNPCCAAYGKNPKELFENSAVALFSIMCEIKKVKPLKSRKISLKADNLQELMFSWLQQLIALVDIEEMFFSKFKIEKISDKRLEATVYGEEISPKKGKVVVKSVTNYRFKVEKNSKSYKATAILDI